MKKNEILKPVMLFGYCLILMGFIIITMHVLSLKRESFATDFTSFAVAISLLHFFIGLGVILKKKWGFHCFKFYLYLLSIGFPIGTFIGLKMLKYIDKNDVRKFFG